MLGGLLAGEVLPAGGFSLLGGLPAGWGVSLPGGSPCQGVSLLGGLPTRGVPWWGVLLARGVLPAGDPPVNRMTDTCKNITLATTLLQPVIINLYIFSCASAKAERRLSSLYGVFLCVELGGPPPARISWV